MENKNHYYDGIIYDKFIAPNQDKLFRIIKTLVPKGSILLDVGTGTGRLPFQFAEHCKYIVGLDLSARNINLAEKKKKQLGVENVDFVHGSVLNLENLTNTRFDYAVTTFVLHEMPPQMRIDALKSMRKVADKIIVGDYIVPLPGGLNGWSVKIVEFLAGRDHFNNFRDFVKRGGIEGLAKQAGMEIVKKISNKLPHAEISVLK
jgi:SAM-dependent methyltransferase